MRAARLLRRVADALDGTEAAARRLAGAALDVAAGLVLLSETTAPPSGGLVEGCQQAAAARLCDRGQGWLLHRVLLGQVMIFYVCGCGRRRRRPLGPLTFASLRFLSRRREDT